MPESPPPLPPNPPPLESSGFHARNWWRQGAACRVLVILAILTFLSLLQPWDSSYSGTYTTESKIGSNSFLRYSVHSDGGRNAFAAGHGWIPAICLAAMLYCCGFQRQSLGGKAWIPFWAAIVIIGCATDAFRAATAEAAKFKGGLDPSSSARVEVAAAICWTIIFGAIMAVAGWRWARQATKKS